MRRALLEVLALLALAAIAAAGTKAFHPKAPALYLVDEKLDSDEVTLAIIEEQWGGDVLWIDARTEELYSAAHIPGALCINPQNTDQQMFEHFESLQTENRPVVIYCASRACEASKQVATYLRERTTLAPILTLRGGWQTWQAANMATSQP